MKKITIVIVILLLIGAVLANWYIIQKPEIQDQTDIQEKSVGYIGCSITLNAIQGYQHLDGKILWSDRDIQGYGGGSVYEWYNGIGDSQNERWLAFRNAINKYPQTNKIWLELCLKEGDSHSYEMVNAITDNIKTIAPDAEIYISSFPAFPDEVAGPKCKGQEGPAELDQIVNQIVENNKAKLGPDMTHLEAIYVDGTGCHATPEGKDIWGQDLLDFFG